jgi:hypothetical protein
MESKPRRRRWQIAGALVTLALMVGTVALLGVAYARQSNKVDDLQTQNREILNQHLAIGLKFAQQSKRLQQESRRLERALRSSYQQGVRTGQEAAHLPRSLRGLARFAVAGIAIPRTIPPQLSRAPRVETDIHGYELHWPGAAVFASTSDPLEVWTRQALGGAVQTVRVGTHRVRRFVGPGGVVFAWRERGCTYATIARPQLEASARSLIRSMR